ncbi:MAG: tetratricopeptide repeat protein [candidate division WOR-3 bacterium]
MHSVLLVLLSQTMELIYGGGKDYELFQKANTMVAQGRYEEAVDLYLEAINLYPSFKEAYNNMGVAYTLLGDTTRAIKAFRDAIRIDSLYIDPFLNMASCYAEMGFGDSAVKYYNQVLKLDPENPSALSAYARAQAQAINQGQTTSSGQGKTGQTDKSQTGQQTSGSGKDKTGKQTSGQEQNTGKTGKDKSSGTQAGGTKPSPDEIKEKEQALTKDPYNPQTYYDIAVLLDKAGRYEEALDYYIGFLNTSKGKTGYEAMQEFAQKRVNELAKALRRK